MALSCTTVPTLVIASKSSSSNLIDRGSKARRSSLLKSGLLLPSSKCVPFRSRRSILVAQQLQRCEVLCAAALNSRCAAEQTQTVTRQSSTITVAPIQGKEKSPELDDGGSGFPPRDDDGGGGGGGGAGGGHHWSGGFFFFGLLAFLGFMKDQESEGPYRDSRRRLIEPPPMCSLFVGLLISFFFLPFPLLIKDQLDLYPSKIF